MQVQEEKVPDRHLGESEIERSRAVFNPQQLLFIGVISINTKHTRILK